MKKGIKVLLFAAAITPFIANADMAAPQFRGYDAVVTKADGIKVCEKNNCETMKNGDKFKIRFAYDESFETEETSKKTKTIYTIVYNGKDYADVELGTDDFRPYTEEVKVTDEDISKLKTPSKIRTLKEVEIRKGPGEAYGLVDKIPTGTELTFQYFTSGEEEFTHVYVEYNGKGGWIEVLHGSVLFIHDFYSLVYKDIKVNNVTIKKGTILKGIGSLDTWSKTNVYNYNGTEVSYCSRCEWEISIIYPVYAKALRDIKVYDEPENGKVVKTIKKGEEFINLIFADEDMGDSAPASYVYYDGVKGYTHYEYGEAPDFDLLDYEEIPDKKVDYKTIGLEEPKEKPYYDLEDDSDLPSPTDQKDDKKEEKKDDKKENNNLYIILGIVTGTVLVVIGFLVGLATKKNKAQEQQ